eukprot:364862-Chlamydomonas_euryale.AAC.12
MGRMGRVHGAHHISTTTTECAGKAGIVLTEQVVPESRVDLSAWEALHGPGSISCRSRAAHAHMSPGHLVHGICRLDAQPHIGL